MAKDAKPCKPNPASFRLSPDARKVIAGIAKRNGITRTAAVELIVRGMLCQNCNGAK